MICEAIYIGYSCYFFFFKLHSKKLMDQQFMLTHCWPRKKKTTSFPLQQQFVRPYSCITHRCPLVWYHVWFTSFSVGLCMFFWDFQRQKEKIKRRRLLMNDGGSSAANNSRRASQSHKYTRMVTRHQSFPLPLVILEKKKKNLISFFLNGRRLLVKKWKRRETTTTTSGQTVY